MFDVFCHRVGSATSCIVSPSITLSPRRAPRGSGIRGVLRSAKGRRCTSEKSGVSSHLTRHNQYEWKSKSTAPFVRKRSPSETAAKCEGEVAGFIHTLVMAKSPNREQKLKRTHKEDKSSKKN